MKTKNIIPIVLAIIFTVIIDSCNNKINSKGEDVFSKLSVQEKNKLNDFFSEFSKIYTDTFSQGKLTDKIKINFAVYYNYRNNFKALEIVNEGNNAAISENIVSKTTEEFFGEKINKNQSVENIAFENNKYIIQQGDGERFLFAQILSLTDKGNDLFDATMQIYAAGSGWSGNPNAAPETWKTSDEIDQLPIPEIKMKAKLKKNSKTETAKYILLEFLYE
jgi:hypothetical protein